jgi:Ala-tRNA(Pro) deacylase
LDLKNIPYQHEMHRRAYTAKQVAQAEHLPDALVAKTVMVKADNRFVMAVVPASMKVDLTALQQAMGARVVRLAMEHEFRALFPDSELGAMPPFGNLYGVPVCVDETLTRNRDIVFNAGTHEDTIRMSYADFARLVQPTVCSFGLAQAA